MRFVIGSTSKIKIEATDKVIRELFKYDTVLIEGYPSISIVPDTPYDKQTFEGAKNRALDAKAHIKDADFCIGLESGLVKRYNHIYEEAWAAVITRDDKEFFGYSSGLRVPDYVLRKMDELKMEHCDVMTVLEEEHKLIVNDTWGSYSGGMLVRKISLEEALRNVLIQIVAPDKSFYKQQPL